MRRIDFYSIKRGDNLGDPDTWNKRFEDIDLRIAQSEDAMLVVDEAAARAEQAAISRINDVITPLAVEAQQRLTSVATIFEATSTTELTLGVGTRQIEIPEGQRLTFAPLAYLVVFPVGDLSRYMAGRVVSYQQSTGTLVIDVVRYVGSGTASSWQIAPMAFVSDLEDLAAAATNAANATAADRAAVAADKATVANDKATSASARDDAVSAKNDAQSALASFLTVYRGALAADPATASVGHFYFNTVQQVAKVYSASGWGPLFSVSLGGVRQGDITATAGQTVFNVGAFTFVNVWLNGVKMVAGDDFTSASPNVTLAVAAAAGDKLSYLGYYATDVTDFYTKELADARYYTKTDADGRFLALANAGAAAVAGLGADVVDNGSGNLTFAPTQSNMTASGHIAVSKRNNIIAAYASANDIVAELPEPAAAGAKWRVTVTNQPISSKNVIVTLPTGSTSNIVARGKFATSITLLPGQGLTLVSQGAGFYHQESGVEAPASESTPGIAEIATQDEVDAGTDDARFVTPKKLAAFVNAAIDALNTTLSAAIAAAAAGNIGGTWQSVSLAKNTARQNTFGKPIVVITELPIQGSTIIDGCTVSISSDGTNYVSIGGSSSATGKETFTFVVPAGHYYKWTSSQVSSNQTFNELR